MSRWRPEHWRRTHELLLAPGVLWDLGDGRRHAGFADWCRTHPGARCRVLLSSAFVVELPVDPSLPLGSDAELVDWARLQLAARGGVRADEARACAAWQSGALRGVSVLHGLTLAALRADAQAQRVTLAAVQPFWSRVLARCARALPPRQPSRLLVVEAARVAAVEAGRDGVGSVETAWLDDAHPGALREWTASRPPAATLVYGHGLAPGELPGWQVWPGLHDEAPLAAWQAGGPP